MRPTCIRCVAIVARSQVPANKIPQQYWKESAADQQTLLNFIESQAAETPNIRTVPHQKLRGPASQPWEDVYNVRNKLHKESLRKLKQQLDRCESLCKRQHNVPGPTFPRSHASILPTRMGEPKWPITQPRAGLNALIQQQPPSSSRMPWYIAFGFSELRPCSIATLVGL